MEEYFDISSQISEAKEGGTAEVTVTKDRISEEFTLYFYDMTLMELLSGIEGISINPADPTTWTAFQDFCSNKHILLEDLTHNQGLSIDKYAQEGEDYNVYIPVFENTYFRGNSGSKSQLSLSSQNVNKHLEISADGITVENVEVTITGAGDIESRVNAAGLFGDDIIIRDCILRNRIADPSSPDKKNTERTGISIQKGFRFASGANPEIPDDILIENTSIEGFDVSVNISGYATLSNVTIDSPIVIAVDQTMLDDLNRIILTDIHSSCDGTDVYLIVPADTADARVIAFENRLKGSGLTVSVESSDVEIGNVTISPWEDGGSWDGEAM